MLRNLLLLALALGLNGCTALMTRTTPYTCPYIGVRMDWALAKENNGVLWPLLALDAPFSGVVDTLMFPFEYQYSCSL
ncbi:YceK/YidQ family lipoprotein [Pseudomonas protegens]|uniref:YceK/YidQ family lipoprotein n=1 Tax=Pseudomonas protegens TaxID=380021 RepID=A0A7G7XAY0_9PSED|nr:MULTISPECIES: YceK/YidQ family lipoprotein [Pseudomonas]MDF2395756.1 YceK/YidQ family lipoprotein [Pseudomonas sp. 3MA1]QNH77125.1 YceK/YidQ family lipoprotein [Pseudomonas protegens]QNL06320.1 YceK/YidQ family lipoprotein [Pseudomonas protegens]